MPTETTDNNSFGFAATTERGKVTSRFQEGVAVTTTQANLFTLDSAQFGGVSMCLTVFNRAASASSVRVRMYVSNDNLRITSNGGRVTLANAYGEDDASISLPVTIAAGATDHLILGYKQQPQLTTFRFWHVDIDVASGSATVDYYFNAK
jgi:hypothetical protein